MTFFKYTTKLFDRNTHRYLDSGPEQCILRVNINKVSLFMQICKKGYTRICDFKSNKN